MDKYNISGTKNLNLIIYKHIDDILKNPYNNFQEEYNSFLKLIKDSFNKNKSLTFIHFGDGDYYFLKKEEIGSAKPGKRALSLSYDKLDMNKFNNGFINCDYICIEVLKYNLLDKFNEIHPNNIINGIGKKHNYISNNKCIPTEFLYAIILNKWIFHNFKGHIGLIGADKKLDLIKELIKRKEYQEYLGIQNFNDYIKIPQKFSCDNLENVKISCEKQLKNSTSKIFLVGIGHVKNGLFYHLKKYKKAIYLDVGACIDAIAGCIDYKRPYSAEWINYRLKNYDYSKIDYLQYESKNEKYLN